MRIGFVSDTHGDAGSWRLAWDKFLAGTDLIIHCGDILYHGPRNPLVDGYNPAELAQILNGCPVPVLYARGNCDADVDQLMIEAPIMSPYVFLQVDGLRIMACHGDNLAEQELLEVARLYKVKLMASGHTHQWTIRQSDDITLINPGSISLPKGKGYPTVAVLEGGCLQIYCIRTGSVLTSVEI